MITLSSSIHSGGEEMIAAGDLATENVITEITNQLWPTFIKTPRGNIPKLPPKFQQTNTCGILRFCSLFKDFQEY